MLKTKMIFVMIMVILFGVNVGWATRSYTYVLTVGMDPNDPGYDPNSNYDTVNAAISEMNQKSPPLDEDTLGCIEVYPGTYTECLDDKYTDSNNLPAHCDLEGKGADANDVMIKIPRNAGIGYHTIVGNGDNIISHLRVDTIYPGVGARNGIKLQNNCTLTDCIVITAHVSVVGQENLIVTDCNISGLGCITAEGTFTISDCNLNPCGDSLIGGTVLETSAGINAKATGTVENVNIYSRVASSTKYLGYGLFGIQLLLDESEFVTVKNLTIDFELTSKYKSGYTEPLHICGILSGQDKYFNPGSESPGLAVFRNCVIDVNGIESSGSDPNDPNDDGAGIMVDGIDIRGGGEIVIWDSNINTGRIKASNADDGYEYLLNNENGTLRVDLDTVAFDPNGSNDPNCYDPNYVNGAITDYRVKNITQDVNYFFIQDAVDDSNDANDIIEVYPSIYYENVDISSKSCTLRGTDPNDWDIIEDTVIDANGGSYAVKFASSTDSNLAGLTLRNAQFDIWCTISSDPIIKNCIIEDATTAGIYAFGTTPTIINNKIRNNAANGMAILGTSAQDIKNNLIYGSAKGINLNGSNSSKVIRNNTIVDNSEAGIYVTSGTSPTISNCIIWDSNDDLYGCSATYSCISDSNDANGTGNISGDANAPLFIDRNNTNYNLYHSGSPCVDTGDPCTTGSLETDIDGEARRTDPNGQIFTDSIIDMGADEFMGKIYNVTKDIWYLTIQDALDDANDANDAADIIELLPGTYYETIDFNGVSCTLRSTDPNNWNVVEQTVINANGSGNVVTFSSGEDANSILAGLTITSGIQGVRCINLSNPIIKNCIIEENFHGIYTAGTAPTVINNKIRNNASAGMAVLSSSAQDIKNNFIYGSNWGIFLTGSNSSKTIRNNTIVDNDTAGIYVASGTSPTISNCILWDNGDDLYDCNATYSCIEDANSGTGNIFSDPCFIDADANNFHLDPNSLCIDAGDPNGTYTCEVDIDFEERVMGPQVDMGADESTDLVECGNFSCSTSWTYDGTYWSISGGKAVFDISEAEEVGEDISQAIDVQVGKKYYVKFKILDWQEYYSLAAGGLNVRFGVYPDLQDIVNLDENDGTGTYTYVATATEGGGISFDAECGYEEADLYIELDDVSVTEIPSQ